jgi:hypothetical protein
VHKVVGSDFKGGPFATLEPDLIKMSFEVFFPFMYSF